VGETGRAVLEGGGRNEGASTAKISGSRENENERVASSSEFLDEAVFLFFLGRLLVGVGGRFYRDIDVRLRRESFLRLSLCPFGCR
jgi:hypothetical protein